jgi:hypothetical protein
MKDVLEEDEAVKPGFSMALHMRKFRSAMSEKCLLLFLEFANATYVDFLGQLPRTAFLLL